MESKRKIRCSCRGIFEEERIVMEGIISSALVCSRCGRVTFTKEQAVEYAEKKETHRVIDSNRKVIRIGNSLGITLPEKLGLKVGRKVRIEAADKKRFVVIMS